MNNYKSFSELKEELGNNYDFKLYEMGISALKEIENLQQRIDKAIEYINENWGHWCSNHCKYATETINILKGSDKE